MEDVLHLKNEISKKAIIYALGVGVISSFFRWQLGAGLVVGALVSVFNFHLLYKYVMKVASNRGNNRARVLYFLWYFARFCLMAVILFLGIKIDVWLFAGMCVGLFAVQLIIYLKYFGKQNATVRNN